MATEKNINSRVQQKHDIEANWNKAINFIPKAGEIIIYDKDNNYDYTRIKIGDGVTSVINLPFSGVSSWNDLTDKPFEEIKTTKLIALTDENTVWNQDGPIEMTTIVGKTESLIIGESYTVIIDDKKYENCICIEGFDTYFSGNCILIGLKDENNEQLGSLICHDRTSGIECYYTKDGKGAIIQIFREVVDIRRLDPKFLPEGYPYVEEGGMVEILPETEAVFSEDDGYMLNGFLSNLVAGQTYIVNYNGVDYECTGLDFSVMQPGAVVLGDIYTASGGEMGESATGEPFALMFADMDGVAMALVVALDGAESITVAISQDDRTIHTIDPKFLPLKFIEGSGSGNGNTLDTLTFDGNLGGKEYIQVDDGVYFVHMSDTFIDSSELIGGTVTIVSNNEKNTYPITDSEGMIIDMSAVIGFPAYIIADLAIYVLSQPITQEGLTLPKGINFLYTQDMHVSELKAPKAIFGSGDNSLILDPKYIKDMYYEEKEEATFFNYNGTITSGDEGLATGLSPMVDGDICTMSINGVDYNCVASQSSLRNNMFKSMCLTGISIDTDVENGKYLEAGFISPEFTIQAGLGSCVYGLYTNDSNLLNTEISITVNGTKVEIKKIDPKFLPDELFESDEVIPISKGGTGATTASEALTNLGIRATASELNYVDGVTSNIQTQLNSKPGLKTIYGEIFNDLVNNKVTGSYSHAEGQITTASAQAAHAEGISTIASGKASHAEGNDTNASAQAAHAEGTQSTASGYHSHAEGNQTTASGNASHAEGTKSTASGAYSHAEGYNTIASGNASHAEGTESTASGYYSHAEGQYTIASGASSHAEGYGTTASGNNSHTEGQYTIASGVSSHAEGSNAVFSADFTITGTANTTVYEINNINSNNEIGKYLLYNNIIAKIIDRSEDDLTITLDKTLSDIDITDVSVRAIRGTASGEGSHTEGSSTTASGYYSHAEGQNTIASGNASHAEGHSTTVSGNNSHAEGQYTIASGQDAHAEGYGTTASGNNSHAEGIKTEASGQGAHAEGYYTTATGNHSHVEGNNITAYGTGSHAEGVGRTFTDFTITGTANTTVYKVNSISSNNKIGRCLSYNNIIAKIIDRSEDDLTITLDKTLSDVDITDVSPNVITGIAYSNYSHAEGYYITASGNSSHAEGTKSTASGEDSHAEGYDTTASGDYGSHAEGYYTIASNNGSHAEGNQTTASGNASHAEGRGATASGQDAHAEGYYTIASNNASHAEGTESTASGAYSHAEGNQTTASGNASHAEGRGATASGDYQHVQGKYNIEDIENKYAHIVGNGDFSSRSNAHTLDWDGNAWFAGNITLGEDKKEVATTDKLIGKIGTGTNAEIFNNAYNKASGNYSHAEGYYTIASGNSSHAEGNGTTASGLYSHAEGGITKASGNYSHAEGSSTIASGTGSHAEGSSTKAFETGSHAEGLHVIAYGQASHAEGSGSILYSSSYTYTGEAGTTTYTISSWNYSNAIGEILHYNNNYAKIIALDKSNLTITVDKTLSNEAINNVEFQYISGVASGESAHVEGANGKARGDYSHVEGFVSIANGEASHAEGKWTIASGQYSHTEGYGTEAIGEYQHVQGKYNRLDHYNTYAHIVGNGSSNTIKSNAHTLDWSGNAWFAGDVYVGSTSGTNKDEGSKKLATEEYVDEKLSTTSSIPRLVTHTFPITATKNGQTVFPINLESFNPFMDTVMVQDSRTMLFPNIGFTVVDNTIVLAEGWNVGDTGCIYVSRIEMYYPLNKITITTLPTKTIYYQDEYFDATGMVVTATYTDGTTKEITNYSYTPNNKLISIGTNIITISYSENGITKTCELNIEVLFDETILQDFTYINNGNNTYSLTGWKGTKNGVPSTEIVIPDNDAIIW